MGQSIVPHTRQAVLGEAMKIEVIHQHDGDDPPPAAPICAGCGLGTSVRIVVSHVTEVLDGAVVKNGPGG